MKTILVFVLLFSVHDVFSLPSLIVEGMTYEVIKNDLPLTVHILRVDPKKFTISPNHAFNSSLGVETTSSIAKRRGAIAAINGGFFKTDGYLKGKSVGILKINHEWYGLPHRPRGAATWNEKDLQLTCDRVTAVAKAHIGTQTITLDDLNAGRGDSQAILFTPSFHPTTLTNPGGKELVVANTTLSLIQEGINDSKIPAPGFVVSFGPRHPLFSSSFQKNCASSYSIQTQPLIDTSETSQKLWNESQHVVGGTPVLIKNGKPIENFDDEMVRETFLTKRHPRTALGMQKDGTWVFVVADGRSTMSSLGMTMKELQQFMVDLGCIEALNLDGGGSSTMTIQNIVVSNPCGTYEDNQNTALRGEIDVSDAILILPKQQQSAPPK